jgi:hypothetical protein
MSTSHSRPTTVPDLHRRTIATGAAWTAPLMMLSVAAPAYAASQCVSGQATLTAGTKPTQLDLLPSNVKATITWSSSGAAGNDQTPGETGEVHTTSYSPSWPYLKMHLPQGMTQGDTVTLTLTFSQAVTNLSLQITDIDKTTGQWIDEVVVAPGPTSAVKSSNVNGSGTSGSPFTAKNNGGISNATGDVVVTWTGPLTQVQITYRAADQDNTSDIGQHIGIGKIGFVC